MSFTGSDALVTSTWGSSLTSPYTVIAVAKSTDNKYLFDAGPSDASQAAVYLAGTDDLKAVTVTTLSFAPAYTSGSLASIVICFNPGTAAKASINSNTLVSGVSLQTVTLTAFTMGCYQGGGAYAGWDIAEMLILDHQISTPDLTNLNAYFHARYGMTIS
jgi:hypothetical protein